MSDDARGVLSLVATPIGNLEDITLRALRTLREADYVLAEDTRQTRKLFERHGLVTSLRSYHAHSESHEELRIISDLREGKKIALVTDAGTPLVSDPGARIVTLAIEAGVRVEAIPGPSAALTALSVAGLRSDDFRFVGFLPRSGAKRKATLARIASDTATTILYEAPSRLHATLSDLAEAVGEDRRAAVARELTKRHEEIRRGTLASLRDSTPEEVLGEITLIVEGAEDRTEATSEDLDTFIARRLGDGASVRDISQELSSLFGLPRKTAYARVLGVTLGRVRN